MSLSKSARGGHFWAMGDLLQATGAEGAACPISSVCWTFPQNTPVVGLVQCLPSTQELVGSCPFQTFYPVGLSIVVVSVRMWEDPMLCGGWWTCAAEFGCRWRPWYLSGRPWVPGACPSGGVWPSQCPGMPLWQWAKTRAQAWGLPYNQLLQC